MTGNSYGEEFGGNTLFLLCVQIMRRDGRAVLESSLGECSENAHSRQPQPVHLGFFSIPTPREEPGVVLCDV